MVCIDQDFGAELLLIELSAPSYDDDFVTLVVPETRTVYGATRRQMFLLLAMPGTVANTP